MKVNRCILRTRIYSIDNNEIKDVIKPKDSKDLAKQFLIKLINIIDQGNCPNLKQDAANTALEEIDTRLCNRRWYKFLSFLPWTNANAVSKLIATARAKINELQVEQKNGTSQKYNQLTSYFEPKPILRGWIKSWAKLSHNDKIPANIGCLCYYFNPSNHKSSKFDQTAKSRQSQNNLNYITIFFEYLGQKIKLVDFENQIKYNKILTEKYSDTNVINSCTDQTVSDFWDEEEDGYLYDKKMGRFKDHVATITTLILNNTA